MRPTTVRMAAALPIVAVTAAAATVGLACGSGSGGNGGPPGGGAHMNPLGQPAIDAFVAAHDDARSGATVPLVPPPSPPLPPVSWDADLADVAYNYLLACHGTMDLVDHNANRTADYAAFGHGDYVGENIYATTADTVAPTAAVASWMAEAAMYDYASGDITTAGHYTQIVWRASVRIGCAIVDCPNLKYHDTVLCDYAPGGNIIGERPY